MGCTCDNITQQFLFKCQYCERVSEVKIIKIASILGISYAKSS